MRSEKISIKNRDGHLLSCQLDLPLDEKPKAYLLFAHCFTCNKNLTAIRNISLAITSQGFALVRFDFTGLGESEGEFSETNFASTVNDLIDVYDYFTKENKQPQVLIGHSLGGSAVVFAAGQLPDVKAIVTVGAPSDPGHVEHLLKDGISDIEKNGCGIVDIGGRNFTIKKQFLEDIRSHSLPETLKQLKKPILVCHSPQDSVVGIDNARKLFESAYHPKSFVSLDGANHLLSDSKDSRFAGNMIASWIERYLSIDEANLSNQKSTNQVNVRITKEKYTTEILSGEHRLLADEPKSVGGKDLGPNPYDLLLSALGACTVMTLRMYADRKGWELDEVEVGLDHKKDYPADCEDCENPKQKIDVLERKIRVEGNLTEEQKSRILEIADLCQIHKTLHSPVDIISSMN